jgi:MYXO-CTERM domain-containing protein
MKTIHFGLVAATSFALTAFASADVIMDQIGDMDGSSTAGGSISASQDFETAYDAYDVVALDDFTIDTAMNLTSASMVLGGWNGFAGSGGVTGYTVSIFSSVEAAGNSIFGDVLNVYLLAGSQGVTIDTDWAGGGELVTFDMLTFSLDAGTYWIGITPDNAFAGNGQTGAYHSDLGDASGAQANPSGAFGFITQPTGANYAYRLDGTAVPAPGVLALLGLAGFAGRRRRS